MSSYLADPPPERIPASTGAAGSPEEAREPADLVAFDIDLTLEEGRRRAEVMREEDAAYALLYSGLDADQQRIYDDLVAAGVLPDREAGRAAH
jgi:hypothetical protein